MTIPDPSELRRIASLCRNAEGPDQTIDVMAWIQIGWSVEDPDARAVWKLKLPLSPDSPVNCVDLATAFERYPTDCSGLCRNWNIPALTASHDAASSVLGDEENPFVLMTKTDFGGLRRARAYDGETVVTSADASTLPLAILAAALDAIAMRIDLGHGIARVRQARS
jgi:hypothetical protein